MVFAWPWFVILNLRIGHNFCKICYWIFPEFIEERRVINGSNFAVSFHWEIDKNYVLAVKEGKLIIKVTVGFLTALSCLQVTPYIISLAAVFWMSRNAPPKVLLGQRCVTSKKPLRGCLSHIRESKTVFDSGFHCGYLELDCRFHRQIFRRLLTPGYLTWGNTKYIERIVAFAKINRSI